MRQTVWVGSWKWNGLIGRRKTEKKRSCLGAMCGCNVIISVKSIQRGLRVVNAEKVSQLSGVLVDILFQTNHHPYWMICHKMKSIAILRGKNDHCH
jgi:hypothetical protein